MAALDNILQSKYLTRPVVKQRNSVTLVGWSGYVSTEPIPAAPDDDWIRARIVAEAMPTTLEFTTQQTLAYFLQDSTTQTNIRLFVSEDNTSDEEISLSQQNETILGTFMPRYAKTFITDEQVQAWKDKNGVTTKG